MLNYTDRCHQRSTFYFSSIKMINTNFVALPLFFSALLNSKAFHISLMACSLEVVMAEKGLPCMWNKSRDCSFNSFLFDWYISGILCGTVDSIVPPSYNYWSQVSGEIAFFEQFHAAMFLFGRWKKCSSDNDFLAFKQTYINHQNSIPTLTAKEQSISLIW